TFAAGVTSQTFTVPITDDTTQEPDETILLALNNPTGGASLGDIPDAVATIVDNDSPGVLQFSVPTLTVTENGGSAVLTVSRTGGSGGTVTVAYATSNGTATAPQDYTA